MFGISFGELLMVVGIGIIILGPKRCVSVAKTLGKTWGKLQKEWRIIKNDLSVDEEIHDLKNDIEAEDDDQPKTNDNDRDE